MHCLVTTSVKYFSRVQFWSLYLELFSSLKHTHTHTHIFQYSNGRNYAEQIIKTRRSVLPVVTTLLISIIRTRPSRLRSTHPNPKRPAIVNRWLGFWAPQLHHYRLTPPTAGNQERRPLKHEPTQARPPNPDAENLGFGRGRPPRGGENKTSGEGRETGGGALTMCSLWSAEPPYSGHLSPIRSSSVLQPALMAAAAARRGEEGE